MIPRIVHLCWLSGDPYPDLIARCIASWSAHLSDYRLQCWDAESLSGHRFPQWVYQAVAAKKYAFAADYIRLFALYHHGGVYLDADVQVLRSLDDMRGEVSFIGKESSGDLEPAVIGAVPQLAWVKSCMQYYEDRSFIKRDGTHDQRPLPLIVGQVLSREYGAELTSPTYSYCPAAQLRICDASYFSPKCRITGEVASTSQTHTIHHFDGQWIEQNFASAAKLSVHRALIGLLGRQGHRKAVRSIRRLLGR